MATYAIGDIQGCYAELRALLALIAFDSVHDVLWFTGDLVNRGPESVKVLRFVRELEESAIVVLGNHDLHLLAVRYVAGRGPRRGDTLDDVLTAPDCEDLLTWLRHRPLLHYDQVLGFGLVHAGLAPIWSFADAGRYAAEVEAALQGARFKHFLAAMYGDGPSVWDPTLRGEARLRFLTNCFTRTRYCTADGALNLKAKGGLGEHRGLIPWFMLPGRASCDTRIVFGHWSTLRLTPTQAQQFHAYPIDTGAVWGGELTALRLDDGVYFSVKASAQTTHAD
jgi:bis(5'-nucleosyl)-tetraphosphatase (symmetrical)